MTMKPVTLPAEPGLTAPPDGIPFVLTPAERSQAAVYRTHLERLRRDRNRLDTAHALGVALEQVA